jgi:hypothetical protein
MIIKCLYCGKIIHRDILVVVTDSGKSFFHSEHCFLHHIDYWSTVFRKAVPRFSTADWDLTAF